MSYSTSRSWKTILHNWLGKQLLKPRKRRGRNGPQTEELEARTMLSATPLDPTFGDGGVVITELSRPSNDGAGDVVYQSDGKALVLASTGDPVVLRYNADGIPDGSFGDLGIARLPRINGARWNAASMTLDQSQRAIIAGTINAGSTEADFVVMRLNTDGSVDTSFGTGGAQLVDFDGSRDFAAQVTVDSLGRVIVAGNSSGGYSVARLLSDGTFDDSFSGDGKHHFELGGGAANSVAVDAQNRILVGGYVTGSSQASWDLAVARLTTSGELDQSFNTVGYATIDFYQARDVGGKISIDSYERIVVMGRSLQSSTGQDIAVARLLDDGTLDQDFSQDGKQLVDINFQNELPIRIAIDQNDRILVGGESRVGSTLEDIAVIRLDETGELDSSFDGDGVRILDFRETVDFGGRLAIDPAGGILVAGTSRDPIVSTQADVGLAKFNDDGSFDTSFSNDGKVTTDIGASRVSSFASEIVAHQPDGKVVVVGHSSSGSFVTAVRYLEDGSRDLAFGDRGVVKFDTHPFSNQDRAVGVRIDDQGRIVVLANGRLSNTNSGSLEDIFVYRLLNDGSLDSEFGTNGQVILDYDNQRDNPTSMDLDSQGRIVISGYSGSSTIITRLNSDGSPDAAFDQTETLGLSLFPFDVAVDHDDNIVFATRIGSDFAVVKVLESGSLDTSFDTDGIATVNIIDHPTNPSRNSNDVVQSIAVDENNKIVLAGRLFNWNDSTIYAAVVRLNPNGSLDTTFSDDGKMFFNFGGDSDFLRSVDIDNQNRIVVAGYTQDTTTFASDFAVARINSDGSLDASFDDGDGKLVLDLGSTSESVASVFVDHRDRILLAGSSAGNIAMVRLATNQAPTANNSTLSVAENTANGTSIGTVDASDPDNDPLTYSILSGNELEAFALNASTGEITVADSTQLDFESATLPKVFTLEVQVDDGQGGTDTATVTINLLNQASITGTVYVDTNLNGLFDGNEMGIDGVAIELLDTNDAVVASTVTSDGGYYQFEDFDPGTYRIREVQPTGVDDGAESLGNLGGSLFGNDVMELTLNRTDASDYDFAEHGQQVTSGDAAGIGFWQNKHGQSLIAQGGSDLAQWLSDNFGNVFGGEFVDEFGVADVTGDDVASFYKDQLFKQKAKKSVGGPAKVDAQFMAVALATYFTSRNLAGDVAAPFGFNVTDTGIGTKIVNVGTNGEAFQVADHTDLTIMQLLSATNALTGAQSGFSYIYDVDGSGSISPEEEALRTMANSIFSLINDGGGI